VTARMFLAGIALLVTACGSHEAGHSDSYRQGYDHTFDYYAIPNNRVSFQHGVQNGYNAATDCRDRMGMGPHPSNEDDWMRGCVDAMHDLGLKP
jgi:hypothetical protein